MKRIRRKSEFSVVCQAASKKAAIRSSLQDSALTSSFKAFCLAKIPMSPLHIEPVEVSFFCKYYGEDQCERSFTSEQAEWEHIIDFHGILAAKE